MTRLGAAGQSNSDLPLPSLGLLAYFRRYLRWYVPRAFHAVRLAHAERFPALAPHTHTIICLNHASWWDPLIALLLAQHLMPRAHHYAPMEAAALRRYSFFRRIGMFPVDTQSSRAAAAFLRTAEGILSRPNTTLWMTPEGQFTDVRQRPVVWRPGLAALVARLPHCTVIPIALEYTFWDERLPEALALIGTPLHIADGARFDRDHWQSILTAAMTQAQNELATLAIARSPDNFTTMLRGRSGIAFIYDAWSRMSARLRGRRFHPEHSSVTRPRIEPRRAPR